MDRGLIGSLEVQMRYRLPGFIGAALPAISDAAGLRIRIAGDVIDAGEVRSVLYREITGLVTEVGGSAVSGRVSLLPFDAGSAGVLRNTFCTSSGRYFFRNVPVGRYVVTATGTGGTLRSKSIHVDTEL